MSELLPHSNYGLRAVSEARKHEVFSNPEDHVHGTLTGYSYGCRCDKCRAANRDYYRVVRAKRKAGWRA